jgi:hypothetical protein
MNQMGLWQAVEQQVHIKQKVVRHRPIDKLKDAFINILAGGHGLVETNLRVRADVALQRAFGRQACAEQSTISETLNACTATTVTELQAALRSLYRTHGHGYHHNYAATDQLLDIDMTGLTAGQQAEAATKGYFPGRRNRCGRQVGRVLASWYDEIVYEQLFAGTVQLEQSLVTLVTAAEDVLELTAERRAKTIIRADAGAGTDDDINWLLARGYCLLVKVRNWRRISKLVATVKTWYPDPKVPERQVGWVSAPFPYAQRTRQVAVRWLTKTGDWHYRVLVFNLSDHQLYALAHQPYVTAPTPAQLLLTALTAYDLRSGSVETSFKGGKQGLGINKRNKRNFHAQAMLVLLAQLAYHTTLWLRRRLTTHATTFQHWGMLRMIRDLFQIPGQVHFDGRGHIQQVTLNQRHKLAAPFVAAIAATCARNDTYINLGKI